MKSKLLLTKSALVWVNEYYKMEDHILLRIFRKDLSESYDVLIDIEDFKKVSNGQWYVCIRRKNSHFKDIIHILYTIKDKDGNKKCYQIHQWILDTKNKNVIIDHVDMNRLDNRRKNLRAVSASVNRINQEYKCFSEKKGKGYCATIRVLGVDIESILYPTKEEAITRYLKACLLCGRDKDSIFIKNKILEYNVSISKEDYNDLFISSVLNGDYIIKQKINKCKDNTKTNINTDNRKSKGYNYDKQTGRFLVRITINNKAVNIGRYSTEFEAETMYLKANIILGNDKISDDIKEMIDYLNVSISEEDYNNKYIQKIILLRDGNDTSLPKELNGRYNLNYDKNIELIHKLYSKGYNYRRIAKYLQENIKGLEHARDTTIKLKLEQYLKQLL